MLIHDTGGLTVYQGDLIDCLPLIAPGTVDAVVTSPPYAEQRKSTYGGVTEFDYPDWTVEWMGALKPALSERASVLINISPHVRGGMLADYVMRMRLALRSDGWFEHDEMVWVKPDGMPHGRPEVPVRSWESILWYSLTPKPFADATRNGNSAGGGARFHTGRATRIGWAHSGLGGNTESDKRSRCKNFLSLSVGANTDEWDHPAPYPVRLAEWMTNNITPDNGTVLDPFAGSGTTAVAAYNNGFKSIAIERDPNYAQMVVDRYQQHTAEGTLTPTLFTEVIG